MTHAERAAEREADKVKGKARIIKTRESKRTATRRRHRRQSKSRDDDDDSGPVVPRAVYTIREFCDAHHISEAFYFKLKNVGLGPAEVRALGKVTISMEAAARWRAERENTITTTTT